MTYVKFNRKPLEKSFNNFVDDLFNELPVVFKNDIPAPQWKGFVPVNITQNETGYSLEVIAPGFEKSDFKITLDQDVLTVSAEKKGETENKDEKQIRKEYTYHSFKRSFTIDEKVDGEKIEAKYVNGVLTLNLPRKEEVKASAKEILVK